MILSGESEVLSPFQGLVVYCFSNQGLTPLAIDRRP